LDQRRRQDQREPDHEPDRVRADREREGNADPQQQEAQPRDGAEGAAAGQLAREEGGRAAVQAAEVRRLERSAGEQARRAAGAARGERERRGAGRERDARALDGSQLHFFPLASGPPSPGWCAWNSRPSRTTRSTKAPKPNASPTSTPQGFVAKRSSTA